MEYYNERIINELTEFFLTGMDAEMLDYWNCLDLVINLTKIIIDWCQ